MRRSLIAGLLLTFSLTSLEPPSVEAQTLNSPSPPPSQPQATAATTPPSNPLIEQLSSPDAGARAKAARELGKTADTSAIPALAAAMTDPSEKVRREVVIALAQMRQTAALEALIPATRDVDEGVRVLAVQGLVGYYSGTVPTPGFMGSMKKGWQRVKGRFTADNTRIDPGFPVAPKVVSALIETLNDSRSVRAAQEAAKGLGILVAQAAVPDLVKAAHSSDEDLSREALNALGKIKDRSAGPQLMDLLDSPNKEIMRDAAVTVGILRAQDALPKLQAIFESDPDQKNKEKAIEGLAYLGEPVSVPLFIKALWSENKGIRISAAEGLARAADPKSLPELEKAVIAETDASAKLAIEYAITALGKHDYLSTVVNELSSKTRGEAAQAHLIELARNPEFLPRLYPYLQSQTASVRRRLCTVLMFSGDQTSLEQLDRLSHDPDGDVAVEALRAKRAIRARLPATGMTP